MFNFNSVIKRVKKNFKFSSAWGKTGLVKLPQEASVKTKTKKSMPKLNLSPRCMDSIFWEDPAQKHTQTHTDTHTHTDTQSHTLLHGTILNAFL